MPTSRLFFVVSRRSFVMFAACVFMVLGWLLQESPAAAHATLQSTTPVRDEVVSSSPESVTLIFDEPVNASLGGVRVLAPGGERVDRGRTESDDTRSYLRVPIDAAAVGTYTVGWRVVSEDGHPLSGTFLFHLSERTGAANEAVEKDSLVLRIVGSGLRWVAYVFSLMALGSLVLSWRMRRDHGMDVRTRTFTFLALAMTVVSIASFGLFLVEVARTSGRSITSSVGLVPDAVQNVRFATLEAIRSALALYGASGWWLMRNRKMRVPGAMALLATIAAVFMTSISGHAWTARWSPLTIAADVVHLVVASVWIGGVLVVLFVFRANVRTEAYAALARWVPVTFVLAVITGVVMAWLQLDSFEALIETTYGQLLLAKTFMVFALAVFGYRLRRRLRHASTSVLSRIGALRIEGAIAVVILALVSVLVQTPPTSNDTARQVSQTVSTEFGSVLIDLTPGQTGVNDLHTYFYGTDGRELALDAAEVSVVLGDLPPRPVPLRPVVPGHFTAEGLDLPNRGLWRFEVVGVQNGNPRSVTVELEVK